MAFGRGCGAVSLSWRRHDEALTRMAATCWAKSQYTDVALFCEDGVLYAHRIVLASMSPLLAALLADAQANDVTVLLPEVTYEDMKLLLQFIYQGEVILPPRRTASLLEIAATLCIAGVTARPSPVSSPATSELRSNFQNETPDSAVADVKSGYYRDDHSLSPTSTDEPINLTYTEAKDRSEEDADSSDQHVVSSSKKNSLVDLKQQAADNLTALAQLVEATQNYVTVPNQGRPQTRKDSKIMKPRDYWTRNSIRSEKSQDSSDCDVEVDVEIRVDIDSDQEVDLRINQDKRPRCDSENDSGVERTENRDVCSRCGQLSDSDHSCNLLKRSKSDCLPYLLPLQDNYQTPYIEAFQQSAAQGYRLFLPPGIGSLPSPQVKGAAPLLPAFYREDEKHQPSGIPVRIPLRSETPPVDNVDNTVSNSVESGRRTKEGYLCNVCQKIFTSSSNLAVHSMIHSGTKPFKCDLCSWAFRQKAHLQKHMRHIHKVAPPGKGHNSIAKSEVCFDNSNSKLDSYPSSTPKLESVST
ncbi:zinc finger and BTB domain-containing protein 18-like [Artemia franciscana]|uniref:Uncharacterized protein n=1 Tax=Artemia franciscana TaxID=6661 RepID=A0AA88HVK2_ARTSF|nr:hypothetical protein QYM36_006910 [Artemia franciscana]KAK2716585.1 hypothetical protein QYM36_006910 [Artemia franciscana]